MHTAQRKAFNLDAVLVQLLHRSQEIQASHSFYHSAIFNADAERSNEQTTKQKKMIIYLHFPYKRSEGCKDRSL